MQIELPNTWAECSFGDIVEIKNGYAFKSSWFKKFKETGTDVPLVKQSQLVAGLVDLSNAVYLDQEFLSSHGEYVVNKGDILIGMSGSIGKVCEYKYDHPALQNQRTGKLVPVSKKLLASKFFGLFLSNIERTLTEKAKGMGVQNISAKDIQGLRFFLPPENEQHRIVAKIEELFSELDKGIESLKTTREQLIIYRQALLKHAFEGKLTEKWREQNADQLESADELLERIQQERETRYQQQLSDWKIEVKQWEKNGKNGKRPSKPITIHKLAKSENEYAARSKHLPQCWLRVKILDLLTCKPSNGRSVPDKKGGFKVLRLTSLKKTYVDIDESKEGNWNYETAKQYLIKKDDFLISRGNGSLKLVGKGALVKDDVNIAYPDTMIKVPIMKEAYHNKLFRCFWNSAIFREQIEKTARTTAGIYKVNQALVSNYDFPLMPIKEQQVIYNVLEKKLSIVDELEFDVEMSIKRSKTLRQSILEKAFSGQLVPQDPNDEPASVLLQKISTEKGEREAQAKAVKKAAKKTSKKKPRKSNKHTQQVSTA